MKRKRAANYPQELLNLFDHYVHGEIGRRQFLDGAAKYAVGGLTVVGIWDSLRPNYALAQQVPKDDERIKTEYVTVTSPEEIVPSLVDVAGSRGTARYATWAR